MLNIRIIRNNTFLEMLFEVLIDNVALDLSDASIVLTAKVNDCGEPVLVLNSGVNGGLTITEPLEGKFVIDEQIFTIKKGIYTYNMTFTLDNNQIFTWVKGNLIVE
jgi:hypothetical protein